MLFSQSGGDQGLGFAIPINRARRVAQEIIAYGRRRNPWFGFRGEALSSLNQSMLEKLDIHEESGVIVTEILRSSPAYQQGLDVGDVVIAVNGESVEHPLDIDFINWGLFIGDEVVLETRRNGKVGIVKFRVVELSAADKNV